MKLSIKQKVGVVVILLIIFFIIINLTGFSKDIKNFFYLVSTPIQKILWQAGDRVTDFFEAISDSRNLQQKNKNLEFKVQELNAKIAGLKEIEKENKALRGALDIGLQKEFDLVFGRITGKNIAQDSILINKGTKDGILKNMPVITQQKIFLGKISDVYRNFSRIMLVSNKDNVIPTNIQIQKQEVDEFINIEALAKGRGSFQIELDRIPIEKEIQDGARVVTSALGGLFPPGILIGYVKNIERLDVELFQRAEVQPAVDVRDVSHVFIITDF